MPKQNSMTTGGAPLNAPVNPLREEYQRQKAAFEAQPLILQRFLEVQGRQVAEAFTGLAQRVHFMLPDRIMMAGLEPAIPQNMREQNVGSLTDFLARRNVHTTLRQRLTELEVGRQRARPMTAGRRTPRTARDPRRPSRCPAAMFGWRCPPP